MVTSSTAASDAVQPQPPGPGNGKAKRVLTGLALLLVIGAGYAGWQWFSYGRFHESTDDAYLQADLVILQARDSGYITEIAIAPNAAVAKGQVIARIDPRDYQLALQTAENGLAAAESSSRQLDAQIIAGDAGILQADAALAAAAAMNDGAQKSFQRARDLKSNSAGTQAALDAAEASAKSAAAQVESAKAALAQSKAQLVVLQAQLDSARLAERSARTLVEKAQLDLDYTEIRAPFDGILTERQIQTGSFVTAGSRIGTLVPIQDLYVGANFKETQIADIRPGAKVSITVDAWPDVTLNGRVESLTAGTGQVFSLLPPSNATGNFTKVVQRVPVRIALEATQIGQLPLRPGMSVVVEVDIRTGEDTRLMPETAPASAPPTAAPAVPTAGQDLPAQDKKG